MVDEVYPDPGEYDKSSDKGNGPGTQTVKQNVVINASGVVLKNKVIDGNLILSEGIGDGEVFLESVTVHGSVYVRDKIAAVLDSRFNTAVSIIFKCAINKPNPQDHV